MIKTKLIPSLDKVFTDENFDNYSPIQNLTALKGERVSLQLLYTYDRDQENRAFAVYRAELCGDLAEYASMREVKSVAVHKPVGIKHDDNYLRTTPGIYPDLLYPLPEGNYFAAGENILNTHWIDIQIPADYAGPLTDLTITVKIYRNDQYITESTATLEIINAVLPDQKLIYTQWYSDQSVVNYYGVKVNSKRHYEIMENYLSLAAKNGMNMVMLPVFRLADIKKSNSTYRFSFAKLGRFIEMCNRIGIRYLEIPHLFTSGDVAGAASIPYTEDGVQKTFEGTSSTDPEYLAFLRAFLKSFLTYMKKRGDDERCYFHIADEPSTKYIETFRTVKNAVADLLEGYHVIDAIFDIEFWEQGLVTTPVPITDHIDPFLEAGIDNLWTYYCTGPQTRYSNRFVAQKGACTRSIGMQLYKYGLKGFLHWALNYYYGGDTPGMVNPYVEMSGKNWVPAGDTFTLYPAPDGTAYESLRLLIFHDAIQDIRAMELCETLYSHEEVVTAIEQELGSELTFAVCAKSTQQMLRVRERINAMIRSKI